MFKYLDVADQLIPQWLSISAPWTDVSFTGEHHILAINCIVILFSVFLLTTFRVKDLLGFSVEDFVSTKMGEYFHPADISFHIPAYFLSKSLPFHLSILYTISPSIHLFITSPSPPFHLIFSTFPSISPQIYDCGEMEIVKLWSFPPRYPGSLDKIAFLYTMYT